MMIDGVELAELPDKVQKRVLRMGKVRQRQAFLDTVNGHVLVAQVEEYQGEQAIKLTDTDGRRVKQIILTAKSFKQLSELVVGHPKKPKKGAKSG